MNFINMTGDIMPYKTLKMHLKKSLYSLKILNNSLKNKYTKNAFNFDRFDQLKYMEKHTDTMDE